MSKSTDHLIDLLRAAGTLALDESQSEEDLVEQRLLLDRISRRIFELSGVPNEDFSEAAYRLADGTGLEPPHGFAAAYVRWRRDLRHVARVCTEMDRDGRTEGILRKFHFTGELTSPPAKTLPPARHSSDFRSVHWYGTNYLFTEAQSKVVAILWKEWENETPNVGHRTLLAKAGSDSDRLQDVFKEKGKPHHAWGTMIVTGGSKGTYRLQAPAV
jgi:hypothetical protein